MPQPNGSHCRKCLVLLSAFVCQLFSAGFANCLGIFYVEFLESFDSGRGVVSWTTSICSGLVFGAVVMVLATTCYGLASIPQAYSFGLVAGVVVEKFGPRISAALGGLFCFVGLLTSAFAGHIGLIYLSFGVLTGTGGCLVCVSSFVSIGQHFGKSRSAASSLAVVGSGLGGLVFPVVLRPIIDHYTWRGAMIIMSALMLNVLPAAGLFATPKQKTEKGNCPKIPEEVHKKGSKPATSLCSASLWRNPTFVCYAIICPIMSIGYQYTFIVIVDLGILLGFSKVRSTLLLTYMSLASTLSTLFLGFALKLLWNYSILLMNLCLVTMSVAMFGFPYATSYATLVVTSVTYGAAIGGINGLYAVVAADLLGLRHYSSGLGIVCSGFGVGYLLSSPIAGVINDITGTYNIAFYVAGSLCLGCVVPFAIIRGIQQRRLRTTRATTTEVTEKDICELEVSK